ncbi:heavy metal translocating P-type ATPase [Amphritea balenae]|uniref:Copper-exporting P-type ATPase n=1 Tax=Amphritea balenae TaxID=452629 RepID=A0A3P1SP32_9GAMM|nr:heavy metal translocating P-type ATPase [Amphritea balenae]RRC98893.1 copper-translocating P-type ATPase [Amphritea balenae]GGK62621.1 copper-translocating P-type ATPase [Amphritea balenae]
MTTTLLLENVSCAGCVKKIEKGINALPEVELACVDFPQRRLNVEGSIDSELLISQLAEIGYRGRLASNEAEDRARQKAQQAQQYKLHIRNTVIALGLGIPLMIAGMLMDEMSVRTPQDQVIWGSVGLLTLLVLLFPGRHFFSGAWSALKNGGATMDTLIAVGTGSAWLFSTAVVLFPEFLPDGSRHVYYEASAMIIGLVNFGLAMEIRARGRTSEAVERLLNLQPKTARVIRNDKEQDLPLELVITGDLLRIRPGEQIPVDAIVEQGQSLIDESMLSGEPLPVSKSPGDTISAGTLNRSGALIVKAEKVGAETALSRIIEMVKQAQASKPEISRLADTVAGIFVPVVIIISIVTALIWYLLGPEPQLAYMLVTATTVLIIACPCALGLATPMSVMVGVGKAAEYGILIRNGQALQNTSELDTLVLDKTGTITEGKPAVTDMLGDNPEQLLQLAASLESASEHPLAEAVVSYAAEQQLQILPVDNFQSYSGRGIAGQINEHKISLGNKAWMLEQNISCRAYESEAEQLAKQAKTPIYVAIDGKLAGLLAIADPIRNDSVAAIARLQAAGIKVIMLTGDNQHTAAAVARRVAVDSFIAEVMPDEKAAEVEKLQQQGAKVGMCGDGINDAPALARADTGFAIGNGTDVAIESADMVLIRNSLHSVADAIELSQATLRNIRQNLFGAFIYNTLGIPVAAGILFPFTGMLLSPVIAGAAMAFSSVTVVSNANRLRLFRPSTEK